jgi:hypothetical protein
VYSCAINYTGNTFYLQTPEVLLNESRNSFTFDAVDDHEIFNCLTELQDTLVKLIVDSSKELFNGRTFTEEKIKKSMTPILKNKEDNIFEVTTEKSDSLEYVDAFGDPMRPIETLESFPARLILRIDSVVFTGSICKVKLVLCKVKISTRQEKKESIQEECILPDSPELSFTTPEETNDSDFFLD